MRTAIDFFEDVIDMKEYLKNKDSRTIFEKGFEQDVEDLYGEWQQLRKDLQRKLDQDTITQLDEIFDSLLDEAKSSRPYVHRCSSYLKPVDKLYIKEIKPKLSSEEIIDRYVQDLENQLNDIEEDKYREYINEAVDCLQANAYRGAVVLGWQGLMFKIYKTMDSSDKSINRAFQEKFNHPPDDDIDSFWDFQKIRDHRILVLSEYLSIYDKSLKDILDNERDVRNKAAHPGKFDVSRNNVKSFLDNIVEGIIKAEEV